MDPEVLEEIRQQLESLQDVRQDELQQHVQDVDDTSQLLNGLLANIPSPPPAEVQDALARLGSELHEERTSLEINQFSLRNEYDYLNARLGPGNAAGARRMLKIQQLGRAWQVSMQNRLNESRDFLQAMQAASNAIRDETIEAELAAQIDLLEQELARPPF